MLHRADLDRPQTVLTWAMDTWGPQLAFTTGLGPGGICLLHMARQHDPDITCTFLDTGFHFPDTLDYLDDIQDFLDVEILSIHPTPLGPTWREDRLKCCDHRKVLPLQKALAGRDAWVNARRADQGGMRGAIPFVERDDAGFVKINPLARKNRAWVDAYISEHGIPRHPLLSQGYGRSGASPAHGSSGPARTSEPDESSRAARPSAASTRD